GRAGTRSGPGCGRGQARTSQRRSASDRPSRVDLVEQSLKRVAHQHSARRYGRHCLLKADREHAALLVKPGTARVEACERAWQDLAVSKGSDLNEQLVATVTDTDLAARCERHRNANSIAMRRGQLDRRYAPLGKPLGGVTAAECGGGHVAQRFQAHNLSPEQWHGLHRQWLETLADLPKLRSLSVLPRSEVRVDDITGHDTFGNDQVRRVSEETQSAI